MKYYTQHDISLGKLRLKIGEAVEPELAAAILGYGIKMDGPAGSGGVSVPALVGPDAAVEQLRRVGPTQTPSLAQRATSARLPGKATARRILGVLDEVAAERVRQDARWGQQNHPSFPTGRRDGWKPPMYRARYYGIVPEDQAKFQTERRAADGRCTYGDIFIEEVAEAIGASNEDRLREELVQCAAVAVAWIEAIDRRKAADVGPVDKHLNGGW